MNSEQHFEITSIQKFSGIKVHNALALNVLLYGSEIWTVRKMDKKRLTSNRDEIFRRKVGYTHFDIHKRHYEIL